MYFVQVFVWATLISRFINGQQQFPQNFTFGVGSSAYQIEGAWKVSDKGESIWDNLTHGKPSKIVDNSTGDVACDSYHLYKRDVEMLKELGVDFYRFSISWPRLLPSGFSDRVSRDGLRYYNSLLDELLSRNITPHVTLYHWDLPQNLQELGGWSNPLMVNYFVDYARVVFESFGSKVKTWITFNGPTLICTNGYGTERNYAPSVSFPGVVEYLCSHHVLLAHSGAFHLYKNEFKPKQGGRVGIALYSPWVEPLSDSTRDQEIANTGMHFALGWHAHPIFSSSGDYPEVMKAAVSNRSSQQGYLQSRLPRFTPQEKQLLKGSSDFLGLNHYTSLVYREHVGQRPHFPEPSVADDLGFESHQLDSWEKSASDWLRINPPGIYNVLKWIQNQYNNPEVIITEVGLSSRPGLIDLHRSAFLQQTLGHVARAVQEGCNVTGLSVWSLMDNFQWTRGYTERFGLYEVDFKSSKKTRTIRISGLVYKNIIETKTVNPFFSPEVSRNFLSSAAGNPHFSVKLLPVAIFLFQLAV